MCLASGYRHTGCRQMQDLQYPQAASFACCCINFCMTQMVTKCAVCCSRDSKGGKVPGEVGGQVACAQRVGPRVHPGQAGQAQAGQLQATPRRCPLLPGRGCLVRALGFIATCECSQCFKSSLWNRLLSSPNAWCRAICTAISCSSEHQIHGHKLHDYIILTGTGVPQLCISLPSLGRISCDQTQCPSVSFASLSELCCFLQVGS